MVTATFAVGDRVIVNAPELASHGREGMITQIDWHDPNFVTAQGVVRVRLDHLTRDLSYYQYRLRLVTPARPVPATIRSTWETTAW